ncbi:MAG: class I SAM-dependent methyltransferase [Ruminococcus sp.]|nr:class I SAM-dependent methyltransferase [Ruminococcus sp.]
MIQKNIYDNVITQSSIFSKLFPRFSRQEKVFRESYRVLKKGGKFIACFFYIRGNSKITDWLVTNVLVKKGWFTPPFPIEIQLKKILGKMYTSSEIHTNGSMIYFVCEK